MIANVIRFSLKYRLLIVLLFIVICAAGVYSLMHIPIDAFPDISPNLVQVFAEVEGTAAEEVEQLVSRPIEVAMMGIPGVKKIRSISSHGLSTVNIYFEDDVSIYLAHQLVSDRLEHAEEEIPEGLDMPHGIEKGPIVSGMGKILAYYLESDTHSTTELRTLQDWVVKRNIQTVPGVADVISQGGHVRQCQIRVFPSKLLKYGLTLEDLTEAIEENNMNLGAGIIERGSEELMVRSLGLIEDISDLEDMVIRVDHGTPVYVRDVASVEFGRAFRRGVASLDEGDEVVVGNVYKLHGANSLEVINRLKKHVAELATTLPDGVRMVPYYDQSQLVRNSTGTVRKALTLGLVLVCIVSFVFLGNLRNAVIVVMSLPFSMLFGFIMMHRYGMPGDLISLGGIAIALGMIVDATIIMVEKIQSALQQQKGDGSITEGILSAGKEVGPPIFFATTIIVLVFTPIFTLGGVEGKMFRPLAFAVTMTMVGSLFYALVVAPAFYCYLAGIRKGKEGGGRYFHLFQQGYESVLGRLLHRRTAVIVAIVILLASGIGLYSRLGKEFVPTLQEGTINVLAHMNPNISLKEIQKTAEELAQDMLTVEEVAYVLTDIGYGEVGPHVHHTNFGCITVGLEPREKWGSAGSQEDIVNKLDRVIGDYPGVSISFSQPIQHEVDALVAGAGATVVAKLFGPDLEVLEAKVVEIESALSTISGVADLRTEQFTGQTQLQIRMNGREISRHGLTKYEIQHLVHNAMAGEEVGRVFRGEKSFGIDVRFAEDYRGDIDSISDMLVQTPTGYTVPLDQLADIRTVTGLRQISREDTRRYISVQCNVRGRDAGGFVEEAQEVLRKKVSLPAGYRLAWGGQFELQQAAGRRLRIIVPVVLFVVLIMIYSLFNKVGNVLLIMLNIPLALVGGIFALTLFGENLSIPSSIGFIALFGIALTNGLILISRIEYLKVTEGLDLRNAVTAGSVSRLRPVFMTAITTALGLLPLIITTGTGSEIQRPLAIVVVGGLISSTLLTLIVLPVFYWHLHRPRSEEIS